MSLKGSTGGYESIYQFNLEFDFKTSFMLAF